jgi:hypothetical protein
MSVASIVAIIGLTLLVGFVIGVVLRAVHLVEGQLATGSKTPVIPIWF